ncbi:MAG: hypothetical protein HFH66_12595 [Lachnospiraceae bacterium]|nr:hypothetical protein [Lachnospiraceae bacterium]
MEKKYYLVEKYMNFYKKFKAEIQYGEYYKDFRREMIPLLKRYKKDGKSVAVWGAGLKGNAFLAAVDAKAEYIEAVVDMSAQLHGTVLATGHKVVGKEYITRNNIDIVFVMNGQFYVENYFMLEKMGYKGIVFDVDYLVGHKIDHKQIYLNNFKQVDLKDDKLFGYKIEEIHGKLLKILEEVDRLCKKYKITYFLEAGSALGAYRYQGFVPCDDDIDIAMFRKDYERFLEIAQKKLKPGFLLQQMSYGSQYMYPYAQVVMDNTCFVRDNFKNLKMHMGIHIDIAPFDTVPDNPGLQEKQFESVRKITKLIRSKMLPENFESRNLFKKCVVNSRYYLLKLVPLALLKRKQDKEFKKYNNMDTGYAGDLCTHYKKTIVFKKSDLLPVRKMRFGNREYPVPCNIETYLETVYGEYKKLSPRETGSIKYDLVAVSLERNYGK